MKALKVAYVVAVLILSVVYLASILIIGDVVLFADRVNEDFILVLRGPPREYMSVSFVGYAIAQTTRFLSLLLIVVGVVYFVALKAMHYGGRNG